MPGALVTGGAGAIGEACVRTLVQDGYQVVVTDVDGTRAGHVAERCGAVSGVTLDVTQSSSVTSGVAAAKELLGDIAVAVNVAGVGGPQFRLHEYSDEDWEHVVGVNLTGVFRCMRAEIAVMLAGSGGNIVTVSSVTASVGFAGAAAYAASKHGVTGVTRAAALEYAGEGIRINAVAPGFVETDLLASRHTAAERDALAASHPLGRLITPGEVAGVVSFLASSRASAVTGSCYGVDGGFLAGPVANAEGSRPVS